MNQLPNKKEARNLACSYEKFLFDHPKFLSSHASNKYSIVHRSKLLPRWCTRTPWLMFTHKDNGTYKVLDPYTKTTYELHVPDLSGCLILASKGGWLFVKGKPLPSILSILSPKREEKPHNYLITTLLAQHSRLLQPPQTA